MKYGYETRTKIDFKKLVSFFLFWILLSGISFANECDNRKPLSDYFDASFECCRASTSIEKYICSVKKLAQSDKELGILYEYIKTYSSEKDRKSLVKKQRAWAKNRIKVCSVPKKFIEDTKVVQCLKDEYLNRMNELGTIIDGDSLELGPWYYAKRDSKDPFAGYYSQFYEVHSATTLEDSSIVENFVHIIKIKDLDMKNKYYIAGNFTCANFHNCTINNGYSNDNSMMEYIIMEPKDGKLFFTQKIDENRTCKFLIEKKREALVLHSADPDCTQYCFSCGVRCGLDGWEFKLKNTYRVVEKNLEKILYPLYKNGKYGYINSKGNWVIKAQFDEAYGFEENGLATVGLDGKRSTINKKGEFTSRRSEDNPEDENSSTDIEQKNLLEEKLYPLKKGDKYGLANKKGEWILEPQFDDINLDDTYSGLIFVTLNGRIGIVDIKGKLISNPKFDEVLVVDETGERVDVNGWIRVKINNKWGIINKEGEWIFKPQFDDVGYFQVTDMVVAKYHGKWGVINVKGKWILKPQFDDIRRYAENDATGFGVATLNGKWGLINDKGEWVLELRLDNTIAVELENIFVLKRMGLLKVGSYYDKWGIVDRKGNWILKQKFDDIEILDDRIHVKFGDQEGYTTLDGKYLTFTKEGLLNERYKDRNSRIYPFVCYAKKSKTDTDKTIYQECVRSETKCSSIEKSHFGEYPNDLKAHEAFKRCSK